MRTKKDLEDSVKKFKEKQLKELDAFLEKKFKVGIEIYEDQNEDVDYITTIRIRIFDKSFTFENDSEENDAGNINNAEIPKKVFKALELLDFDYGTIQYITGVIDMVHHSEYAEVGEINVNNKSELLKRIIYLTNFSNNERIKLYAKYKSEN